MFLIIITLSLAAQNRSDKYLPYDKELAIKYGLEIAESSDYLEPAHEWLTGHLKTGSLCRMKTGKICSGEIDSNRSRTGGKNLNKKILSYE
ncbi:MAG: hypothetical protein ABFS32_20385 [Bacteroidota bacterium]